jgi:competence protein ComFA
MGFSLSPAQQAISDHLIDNYNKKKNTLIMAVCGSGKTEMSFGVISYVLNHDGRVCFTIPRRALCIELYERFKECFEGCEIGLIYGGHLEHGEAPFIICTAHQLYRFVSTPFDLLLMDEADAFPFYGDDVLEAMFMQCVGGCFVKMSATLTSHDIHDEDILIMNRRYHGHDLPIPHIRLLPKPFWFLYLRVVIKKMLAAKQKVLVYVPRREDLAYYAKHLKCFKVAAVSSHTPDINKYVDELRTGKVEVLLTTTILERGVTIDNAQAIVMEASHLIFDERTLMQIAGRVGRKIGHEDGLVIFCDRYISKEERACVKTTKKLNTMNV